ncbi:MAG: hypothetical protein ABSG99_02885 [Sedimentisphaerales bacterium]
MNYWLAQLLSALGGQVLAAQNSDERDTGWVQILVFVILAIFYAVGSIVKARANKTAPKGREQTPRKPAREPPESTIEIQLLKQLWRPARPTPGSQRRMQVQTQRRKVASPQPAGMAMLEPQVVKPQVAMPQVQPKLEKVTAEAAAAVAMPQAEIPRAEYLSEILSDYEDPEKLRMAILHYEILGKPMSLRDSQGYT